MADLPDDAVPAVATPGADAVLACAKALGERLRDTGWSVATAESCTGGLIASALTEFAGSSAWFDRGFVTYSNEAKQEMLQVDPRSLQEHGAVSEETARQMAIGALGASLARIALAVTGIAGPGGGSPQKPVGTVCFAWAIEGGGVTTETLRLPGDRAAVRLGTAFHALSRALELVAAFGSAESPGGSSGDTAARVRGHPVDPKD